MTPEEIKKIGEKLEITYGFVGRRLTDKLIENILNVFTFNGKPQIMPTTMYKLRMLKFSSDLYNFILDFFKNDKDVKQVVNQSFIESAEKISEDIQKSTAKIIKEVNKIDSSVSKIDPPTFNDKVTQDLTKKEIRVIEAEIQKTNGEMYNLTSTTADATQKTFIEICDKAYNKQRLGVDPNTAIVEAIKEASEAGINTVTYTKNGRTIHTPIETALARCIRTGIAQTNAEITLTRAGEMRINYVKVSAHLGARVTKRNDYTNHSWWQGKIYKLNWKNPILSKYIPTYSEAQENTAGFKYLKEVSDREKDEFDYPDFIETCGYGDVQGICGANCRHTFTIWFPNINIDNSIPIDPKTNEDYYNKTQVARAMERKIRKLKKEIEALKTARENANDDDLISKIDTEIKSKKSKLKSEAEIYRDYCKTNKIPQANWRLQI